MERVLSSRTFRSGRVAKMTYSETDEPDATHQESCLQPQHVYAREVRGCTHDGLRRGGCCRGLYTVEDVEIQYVAYIIY